MSETSRRKFIAAAGVSAAAGSALIAGSGRAEAVPDPRRAQEPVLALVDDHRGSVVRLLVGEREIVVEDRDLVTRILNAAGGN
ncbi:twin-arginine translocation signal domain-containing protein [Nocardioides sp.]|uniref:twin-arginine translocation signal domain-containing protein n=1 Tax=Nocardioides sp. TaxID=35761 RepID=UPI0035139BC0